MRLLCTLLLASALGCSSTRVGDRCGDDEDCEAISRGYCSRVQVCTLDCSAAGSPCPEGSACAQVETRQVCLATCGEDADCHADERCVAQGGSRICIVSDPLQRPR